MEKLEIQIIENGLDKLEFLNDEPTLLMGYHPLRYKSTIGARKSRPRGTVLKFELFAETVSPIIIKKLNLIDSVLAIHHSSCEQAVLADLEPPETLKQERTDNRIAPLIDASSPVSPEPNSARPGLQGGISIAVEKLPAGRLQINVKTDNTRYFLFKVFGVLAQNGITLISGRTYPQGGLIIGSFIIGRINKEMIDEVTAQLDKVLSRQEMGNGGFSSFIRPQLAENDLSISLETAGKLPAVRMLAASEELLLRYAFQEVLGTFDIDVTISRLGSRGKQIEDLYYIKSDQALSIDQSLIAQIKNHIFGVK